MNMNLSFEKIIAGSNVLIFKFIEVVIVFFIFIILSYALRSNIRHFSKNIEPEKKIVIDLICNIINIVLITVGIITALGTVGVNVSAIVAGLGLTGFAIGFALKDILASIIAGITIILSKPFKIGDRVSVNNNEGTIMSIDLRYILIENEEKKFFVPNSMALSNVISVDKEK